MKKSAVALKIAPHMAETAEKEFLSIPEAADLVSVSPATIRRFLTQRRLTRFKFFTRTLINKAELIAKIQKVA